MDAIAMPWSAARRSFEIESDAIAAALKVIPENTFMQAVSALAQTERIAASGCGHSGIACMHFAHLMCCIERPARFLSPAEATHGGTGFLKAGDVILLASRGGKTRELIPIMEIARKKGAKIIAVTENQASPLPWARISYCPSPSPGKPTASTVRVPKETMSYGEAAQ